MLFGILIHMLHALLHGTVNLLLVNLKNIVFMNQNLEHVIVFIEVKLSRAFILEFYCNFAFLVLRIQNF